LVVQQLAAVLRSPVADMVTKEYTINALMKLTSRFAAGTPALALIHKQLAQYSTSMSLELQQRSVEYASLLKLDSIAGGVLERMPAFTKKDRGPKNLESDLRDVPDGGGAGMDALPTPSASAAPAAPSGEPDLLSDLMGLSGGAPAAPSGMPSAAPPPGVGGGMDDLLGLLGGPSPTPAATPPPGMGGGVDVMASMMGGMAMGGAPAAPPGSFPPFQAWNKNGLVIEFVCSKDPSNPSITTVEASFTNQTAAQMDGLNFQVAVPKYMQLQMKPPSSTSVPAGGAGKATQTFRLANSMHGQKPIVLKVKIEYSAMGSPVSEMGTVDNFPAGL
jgi:AP-1 complex subunit gamma-1